MLASLCKYEEMMETWTPSPPPVIWHGKTSNHLIQVDVVGALTSMFSNPKATKNVTTVVLTFQGLTSPNIPCLLREQ